jgi:hypothetical protein
MDVGINEIINTGKTRESAKTSRVEADRWVWALHSLYPASGDTAECWGIGMGDRDDSYFDCTIQSSLL